jgi:DNA-binding NtrC family response regulator
LPPVRARRADVLDWIDRLHRRWQAERSHPHGPPPALDALAAEALLLGPWPDNLRGLDRLVHALASAQAPRGDTPITLDGLPAWVRAAPAAPAAAPAVTPAGGAAAATAAEAPAARRAAPTREELEAALARADGSVRATARYFGRDRRQIYRWMEAFGLKEKERS